MRDDRIYRKLQRHLDKQPVGFPRDRSGSDIRLLKHHFSVEEAVIALAMSYRYETVDIIMDRIPGFIKMKGALIPDVADLRKCLDSMSQKISIMRKEENGIIYYCLVPLVIGMYEGKVFEMDAEYLEAYDSYAHAMQHGLSFISTYVPQMRTIPIEAVIPAVHDIMQYDDVREHINNTSGPIFIIECSCRKRKKIHGDPCKQTQRSETCMVFGDIAKVMLRFNQGREVRKDEALEIIRENQLEGLVLQTYNMQHPEVICSCCSCCCEVLGIHRMLPNPRIFTSASYHAAIDPGKCIGCRQCEKKCQVGALTFDKKKKKISVVDKRCIGCGNCLPACKAGAVSLLKKMDAPVPPADFEGLQEVIMRGKPLWRLGRIIRRTLTK
ncbi:MAG TPA: 4Fe-4S binding protein [Spirochaetota bacterium]|nr:4Fe-4S binding protein [Spirochaetota bacterium]